MSRESVNAIRPEDDTMAGVEEQCVQKGGEEVELSSEEEEGGQR